MNGWLWFLVCWGALIILAIPIFGRALRRARERREQWERQATWHQQRAAECDATRQAAGYQRTHR